MLFLCSFPARIRILFSPPIQILQNCFEVRASAPVSKEIAGLHSATVKPKLSGLPWAFGVIQRLPNKTLQVQNPLHYSKIIWELTQLTESNFFSVLNQRRNIVKATTMPEVNVTVPVTVPVKKFITLALVLLLNVTVKLPVVGVIG